MKTRLHNIFQTTNDPVDRPVHFLQVVAFLITIHLQLDITLALF